MFYNIISNIYEEINVVFFKLCKYERFYFSFMKIYNMDIMIHIIYKIIVHTIMSI